MFIMTKLTIGRMDAWSYQIIISSMARLNDDRRVLRQYKNRRNVALFQDSVYNHGF